MDVKFDWDSALSFEGATGPYVQNAHVRLCSIMRKAGYDVALQDVQFEQLTDDHAYELIKFLAQKSDRIRKACETDEPCELAQYALDIAGAAHKFIHEDRVLGSAEEKSLLFFVKCTQIVLEDVLNLLGLFPVRNM